VSELLTSFGSPIYSFSHCPASDTRRLGELLKVKIWAVSFFLIFILPALSQGLDKVIQRSLVFGIGVESFAALFHGGFVLSRLQVPFLPGCHGRRQAGKQCICINFDPLCLDAFHVTPVIGRAVTSLVSGPDATMLGPSTIVGTL
jgi:hypothetical protein